VHGLSGVSCCSVIHRTYASLPVRLRYCDRLSMSINFFNVILFHCLELLFVSRRKKSSTASCKFPCSSFKSTTYTDKPRAKRTTLAPLSINYAGPVEVAEALAQVILFLFNNLNSYGVLTLHRTNCHGATPLLPPVLKPNGFHKPMHTLWVMCIFSIL